MQGYTRGLVIDTDATLSADSDLVAPSQQAVKSYVDGRFIYVSPDTSGSTITLNCDSAHQAMFDLSTLAADKTFVFTNVTNLKVFTCKVNCTGTRAFTFPSSVQKLISTESRFDNGTYVLTLDAGLYEFSISKWGSDYLIVIS